jgi:PPOX class probable F420-dependent enzyme
MDQLGQASVSLVTDLKLARLAGERYVSLTTFKRDGTRVATPVGVASDDGRRLLIWTGADTWKLKRLRNNPRALAAVRDLSGNEHGPRVTARSRILSDADLSAQLMRRKYRVQQAALDLRGAFLRIVLRRPPTAMVTIELVDGP